MKLYSWQRPDFSLIDGCVDHDRSDHAQTVSGLRVAYVELAERLGTNQIVWCCTQPARIPWYARIEWVLEVPNDEIIAFVDEIIWNRILGIRCSLPAEIRFRMKNQAITRYPDDPKARHRYEDELRDRFWEQQPSGQSWWDQLFVEPQAGECVSSLIRHPVKPEWVIVNPLTTSEG